MIRRDRDRSRDFLADVSHELRTPIAALRTFNELLKGQAGADPEARSEFLESGGQQIDRLDWLATNLLELSKLDSGLVLLELRPDDLRAAVEDAVEQAEGTAQKRNIALRLHLPQRPVRIRHDPQRIKMQRNCGRLPIGRDGPHQSLLFKIAGNLDRKHAPLASWKEVSGLTLVRTSRLNAVVRPNRYVQRLFLIPIEIADKKGERSVVVLVPTFERARHAGA